MVVETILQCRLSSLACWLDGRREEEQEQKSRSEMRWKEERLAM